MKGTLPEEMYHTPLTLKTYIPPKWKKVRVTQGTKIQTLKPEAATSAGIGNYVIYRANPNGKVIILAGR